MILGILWKSSLLAIAGGRNNEGLGMTRKEYSAGAVKHSFWFNEFKKTVTLLLAGNSMDDVKRLSHEENIFAAPTTARASQIYNTVSTRVLSLDSSFYAFFENGELATQKIITLISIMNTDTLFFDFMYEVYREKLILGDTQLRDSDLRIFSKTSRWKMSVWPGGKITP